LIFAGLCKLGKLNPVYFSTNIASHIVDNSAFPKKVGKGGISSLAMLDELYLGVSKSPAFSAA